MGNVIFPHGCKNRAADQPADSSLVSMIKSEYRFTQQTSKLGAQSVAAIATGASVSS